MPHASKVCVTKMPAKSNASSMSAPAAFGVSSRLARAARRSWAVRLFDAAVNALLPVRRGQAPLPPPPEVPAHLVDDEIQLEGEGFGRLLGRQYVMRLRTTMTAPALCASIMQHLTALVPDELAAFEKTTGTSPLLEVGDEFDIRIFGPWNGRVRVIEVTPSAFTFVTLSGHPEAGRIRFAVAEDTAGVLAVGITSWARCRDAAVDLGYGPIGKRLQTTTWATFLDRVAVLADARRIGRIDLSEQDLHDVAHDVQSSAT